MDIYELLESEHNHIRDIFLSLQKMEKPSVSKEHVFVQLQKYLLAHLQVEEAVFYAALAERDKTFADNIERSVKEHGHIERLLEQLETMEMGERWDTVLHHLQEEVEAHLDREETEIFSVAQSNFSEEEAESLAEQVKVRKRLIIQIGEDAA